MLDLNRIKAVSLDLDDTLWPIWPTIERAEKALDRWFIEHAPMAAALFSDTTARQDLRTHVMQTRPEWKHNLSAIRREAIRLALYRSGENPLLAEAAFEVFYAERNRVTLFDDVVLALEFLSSRFPLVALSNGNASLDLVGLKPYFRASISAQQFGSSKPDAAIFHAAAGAVNVAPEEVLHIGDDAVLDVLGALNAGMQAIWINRGDSAWTHQSAPHKIVSTLTQVCDLFVDLDSGLQEDLSLCAGGVSI